MTHWVLVIAGGGAGAGFRYALSRLLPFDPNTATWPWATMVANIAACFFLGWLLGWRLLQAATDQHATALWLLFATGFCGGLSTFSTLVLEIHHQATAQQWGLLILYTIVSLVLGYASLYLGLRMAR